MRRSARPTFGHLCSVFHDAYTCKTLGYRSFLPLLSTHTRTVDVRELCNARRFFRHAHGESAEFAADRLRGDVELEVATAR
eukprot:35049-Pleurochrysis_carterae.AAC.1